MKGRPAGLLFSLVYDEQQVLGLAKLPAKPRKRHTGAAWGGGGEHRDGEAITAARHMLADTGDGGGGVLTLMGTEDTAH